MAKEITDKVKELKSRIGNLDCSGEECYNRVWEIVQLAQAMCAERDEQLKEWQAAHCKAVQEIDEMRNIRNGLRMELTSLKSTKSDTELLEFLNRMEVEIKAEKLISEPGTTRRNIAIAVLATLKLTKDQIKLIDKS